MRGITETLTAHLGNNVHYTIKNAQGAIDQLHLLAQQFHTDDTVNLIITVGTPATQAMAIVEHTKPILFAALTDPTALSLENNVCGITDNIPAQEHIPWINTICPNCTTVGLLHNIAEHNSIIQVKYMQEELKKHNIQAISIGITNSADIPAALNALDHIDLVWVPTDNTVAASIAYVAHKIQELKKPLLVSFDCPQALCSVGINYYQHGTQTANMALDIIQQQKKPRNIGIQSPQLHQILINKKSAEALALTLDPQVLSYVTLV